MSRNGTASDLTCHACCFFTRPSCSYCSANSRLASSLPPSSLGDRQIVEGQTHPSEVRLLLFVFFASAFALQRTAAWGVKRAEVGQHLRIALDPDLA